MDIILIIAGAGLQILGLVGCVLPALPGPPLSWLGLLLLHLAADPSPFSLLFLGITLAAALGVTVLDYIVPASGAKKAGAGSAGTWGSVIGMIVGTFAFPPFGMFIGAFVGAALGELLAGKSSIHSLRAAWGVFKGILFGTVLKLAVSGVICWYFCINAFF